MTRSTRAAKGKTGTIAALDIGTSKIACFIAHADAEDRIRIAGIGHQLAKGIRAGQITDIAEAETSIIAAVHSAEQMAGETIENVIINLSGPHLASRTVSLELAVAGEGVSERDIADILVEARASVETSDQIIIHCFPVTYYLDHIKGIKDPRGMMGNRLGADLHIVTASRGMLRNLENCIARCHLNVQDYVVGGHAAALACLEQDEMDLGVTLIDMGGSSTSFSIFSGGKNIYVDSVPLGGMHVTNDVAKGLSTTLIHAERLKTIHGSAISSSADEQAMIDVPQLGEENGGEGNFMPRSMLVGIIRPRLEEIFEMIRGRIEARGLEKLSGRRVVLTGGASQLIGIRDLAARVLSRQVRIGKPHPLPGLAEAVSGPAFSVATGMLAFSQKKPMEDRIFAQHPSNTGFYGALGKMVGWVKENF